MRPESSEGGRFTAWVVACTVLLASVLLALGLAAYAMHGGAGQPLQVRGVRELIAHAVRGSLRFQARGLVEAGLLVLLFAPLLRLFAGVLGGVGVRNGFFVAIGMLVAALMLAGIFLGMR